MGRGTQDLLKALSEPGAKKLPDMDVREDMVPKDKDLINPVCPDGEAPIAVMHDRNHRGRKPGPDGVGRPGISSRREVDSWDAGSDDDPRRPDGAWMIPRP